MRNDDLVYGMSQEDIDNNYINSLTTRLSGIEMTVASVLSDCQEMLAMIDPASPSSVMRNIEAVRKQLNVAKYILFETKKD
jgi:hypothetical protein